MPAVPIKDREQYIKALEVLDRVGGTWHGVGDEERYLLVTPAQYQALVEANVVLAAEVVVQDAAAYQRLTTLAERAEMMEFLREAKADADAGQTVSARKFLQSLGQKKKAKKA